MSKHFFDFEDGDFCFSLSDNMAMDSDGNMMMRIKEEVESMSKKLTELNKEDLEPVTGGEILPDECPCPYGFQSANKQCFKKTVERLKYPGEINLNAVLTVKQYTNTNTSHMMSKQESINSD